MRWQNEADRERRVLYPENLPPVDLGGLRNPLPFYALVFPENIPIIPVIPTIIPTTSQLF